MAERQVACAECGTLMAVLRDARVRKDMVVYCRPCNEALQQQLRDMTRLADSGIPPGFLAGLFGKR